MLCLGLIEKWPTVVKLLNKKVLSHNILALTNHLPFQLTYFQPTIIVSKYYYPFIHLSMQSTNSPTHCNNHLTVHLRHIQPVIIPYHPLHRQLVPIVPRRLAVRVRCVGEIPLSAGWRAVDVVSNKNATPRSHEQNLSSRVL
jgi:hypothetical protein